MQLKTKLRLVRLLIVFLTLIVMTGCATGSTGPVPLNSYCALAQPIGYDSRRDTRETVAAIEKHNSRWVCVCESDCPKRSPLP